MRGLRESRVRPSSCRFSASESDHPIDRLVIRVVRARGRPVNSMTSTTSRSMGGRVAALLSVLLVAAASAGAARAATPGMMMDIDNWRAFFFDADTDTITGSVTLD